ncbi:MAG: hypothetical protein ABUS54_05420 [Actinomycetota bacterium]
MNTSYVTLGAEGTFVEQLASIARLCEQRLAAFVDVAAMQPDAAFRNIVTFAIGTLRAAADHAPLSDTDIRLVRDAAVDAADVCRERGLDGDLLAAAAAFDRAVALCQRALGVRFA